MPLISLLGAGPHFFFNIGLGWKLPLPLIGASPYERRAFFVVGILPTFLHLEWHMIVNRLGTNVVRMLPYCCDVSCFLSF